MLEKLNDHLTSLYKVSIDGKDLDTIAELSNISRFTVWQYFAGKGKSVSTAEILLNHAMYIINTRNQTIERAEILNDYSTND